MLTLQIVCTIVSAILIAAILPVGSIFGWSWAGACGFVAAFFACLMLFFKRMQPTPPENEDQEEKEE